jgi:hypothetical protein
MNAGLPGTGIGGVFYLLCALIMPFIELINLLRGRSSLERWQFIFKQLLMGGGMIGGMWLLGLVLGMIIVVPTDLNISRYINVFHIAPVFMAFVTLSIVLIVANILRLIFRPN